MEKARHKTLPSFCDYGNLRFKNVSSNPVPPDHWKLHLQKKQPEALLTRKGSRHQRNSMEASQRRAQNRNQSLKALERIVYSRGKIGT